MIRTKKKVRGTITINLDGPDGNAWYLLGVADQLAKQFRLNAKAIIAKMKEKDYAHLVKNLDKYFGRVLILEHENPIEGIADSPAVSGSSVRSRSRNRAKRTRTNTGESTVSVGTTGDDSAA